MNGEGELAKTLLEQFRLQTEKRGGSMRNGSTVINGAKSSGLREPTEHGEKVTESAGAVSTSMDLSPRRL